jgi:hypothetical protein
VNRELAGGSEEGALFSRSLGVLSRPACSCGGAMSSLVERLRVRSEKRPLYTLDESDDDLPPRDGAGKGKDPQNDVPVERIEREDAVWLIRALLHMLFVVNFAEASW